MSAFLGGDIILSGTMSKKGHLIMNWKERFIVLTENRIEYFVDSTMKERKGELPVTDETVVEGRVGSIHEFKFTVKTGLRSLTISAPTAEMREEWTLAVRKLVQLKVSGLNVKELSTSSAPASANKTAGAGQPALRRRNKQPAGATNVSVAKEGPNDTGRSQRASSEAGESPTPLSRRKYSADAGVAGDPSVSANRNSTNLSKASQHVAADGTTVQRPMSTPIGSSCIPPKASASASVVAEQSSTIDDGWEKVESPEGTYYYHKKTRVSRWDKPDEAVSAAMKTRVEDAERSADSAFKMRKQQMELEKIAAEEKAAVLDHIKPEVLRLLSSWKEPSPGQPSDLVMLINSLPSILPHLHEEVSAGRFAPYLKEDADSSEVKRAYFRAIRFLHPDKLPSSLDICDKMVAEHAFAYLCEVFQLYREMIA